MEFRNNKLSRSFQNNKAVWITAITLVVALAIVSVLAVSANRAKKNPLPDGGKDKQTDTQKTPVDPSQSGEPEKKPDESEKQSETDAVSTLPSFLLPVSGRMSEAHSVDIQVFSDTMNDYRVHPGIDIAAIDSTPVLAAADGTVAEIWDDPMMGKCVALTHAGDAVTVYKNLSLTLPDGLAAGNTVKAGDVIGYVGETAMVEIAEEPHLHFEMTVGGIAVDPVEYFDASAVSVLATDTSFEEPVA